MTTTQIIRSCTITNLV